MKHNVLLTCLVVVLVFNLAGVADAESVFMAKRFGAGLQVNVLNLGIGPCAEYWLTENLGVMAAVGAFFNFSSVSIRGNYLLNRDFTISGYAARPYVGAGFASVKADYGPSIEQKGSGLEVYGGLLHHAAHIMENLYVRGEFIISTLKFETSGTTSYGETIEVGDLNWGFFSFGGGVTYYF